MFEESVSSIPSIWASMNSWLTPPVLFVFLNLTIVTIAITSSLGKQKHQDRQEKEEEEAAQEHPQRPQLARSASVLHRLKSINFYIYRSQETATTVEKNPETETHYAVKELHAEEQPQLPRSPSMLQRLNLYSYLSREPSTSQPPTTVTTMTTTGLHKTQEFDTHYTFQQPQEKEEEEHDQAQDEYEDEEEDEEQDQYQGQTMDEIFGRLQEAHVTRTKSDTKPASGEVPTKLSRKMKKSASANSTFAHFEEDDIVETRRPATVREVKVGATEADDEVDAKADDFINKFKHQLKLQRMDSILGYKEMIRGGSGE